MAYNEMDLLYRLVRPSIKITLASTFTAEQRISCFLCMCYSVFYIQWDRVRSLREQRRIYKLKVPFTFLIVRSCKKLYVILLKLFIFTIIFDYVVTLVGITFDFVVVQMDYLVRYCDWFMSLCNIIRSLIIGISQGRRLCCKSCGYRIYFSTCWSVLALPN